MATIVDITTRKTTEETFATVIQSSLFAVLIVDHEGCIRFANETVRELFGYSVEDLKGKKSRSFSLTVSDPHTRGIARTISPNRR